MSNKNTNCTEKKLKVLSTKNPAVYNLGDKLINSNWKTSNPKNQPVFKHDCPDCIFLDTILDDDGERVDLYICSTRTLLKDKSIIQRYGNEESEYNSYPIIVLNEMKTIIRAANKVIIAPSVKTLFHGLSIAKRKNLI